MTQISVRIQSEDFHIEEELSLLHDHRLSVGAVVNFIGYCRDEDGNLAALELEYYRGMAEQQLHSFIGSACQRWPIEAIHVIHRVGRIHPGEKIVFTGVSARHRKEAFAAVEYVMDYLKSEAPFWKKHHYLDNSEEWVRATSSDLQSLRRW